jgi:hypothetical protein
VRLLRPRGGFIAAAMGAGQSTSPHAPQHSCHNPFLEAEQAAHLQLLLSCSRARQVGDAVVGHVSPVRVGHWHMLTVHAAHHCRLQACSTARGCHS